MTDPLSPSALGSEVEMHSARAKLMAFILDEGRREDFRATVDALIAAVLQAERQRLLGMTPESVVEAAMEAVRLSGAVLNGGCKGECCAPEYRKAVEAALPLLLAPEVAKREAAERSLAIATERGDNAWQEVERALERANTAERKRDEARRFFAEELRDLNERYDGEVALNAGIAGNFRCDKCGFVLQKNTLNTKTGALGVFPLHVLEDCPNGCGSMRGSTWRDLCLDARKACDAFTERMLTAEAEVARLRGALGKILDTPGIRFHRASCASNEFGVGVARLGMECDCDLGANVATARAALGGGR